MKTVVVVLAILLLLAGCGDTSESTKTYVSDDFGFSLTYDSSKLTVEDSGPALDERESLGVVFLDKARPTDMFQAQLLVTRHDQPYSEERIRDEVDLILRHTSGLAGLGDDFMVRWG